MPLFPALFASAVEVLEASVSATPIAFAFPSLFLRLRAAPTFYDAALLFPVTAVGDGQ